MARNVYLLDKDSWDEDITSIRSKILDKYESSSSYMREWFVDSKWEKNQFSFTTVAYDNEGEVLGLSSSKIFPDKTMKILCHYYLLPQYRVNYRSLSQTDLIPHYVQYALSNMLKGVWFTVHCFDKRHERLKKSILRGLNGGQLSAKDQPFSSSFKYHGEITYNNVPQDKFYYNLTEND